MKTMEYHKAKNPGIFWVCTLCCLLMTFAMKMVYYSALVTRPPYYSEFSLMEKLQDFLWTLAVIIISYLIITKVIHTTKKYDKNRLFLICASVVLVPFLWIAATDFVGLSFYYRTNGHIFWTPFLVEFITIDIHIVGYLFAIFTPFIIDKMKKREDFVLQIFLCNFLIGIYSWLSHTLKPGFFWSMALLLSICVMSDRCKEKVVSVLITIVVVAMNYLQLIIRWNTNKNTPAMIYQRVTGYLPIEEYARKPLYISLGLAIGCILLLLYIFVWYKILTKPVLLSICLGGCILIMSILGWFHVLMMDFSIFPFGRYIGCYYYIWLVYLISYGKNAMGKKEKNAFPKERGL